ncbi:MAG: hypothetical protein B6I22_13355 [Desulfobacteraceae bacterium 4572_123]|nr:MAG: hypothetical protein B6I22_13355 [Desulfobacteraceae bacterium 4572_123]
MSSDISPEHTCSTLFIRPFPGEGAYLLDPVYQALFRGIEPGFYHLKELSPDNFKQSEYYRVYYKATGIVEDVLYLVMLDEDTSLSIMLGRDLGKPPYTEQEQNRLRIVEPIVRNAGKLS